MKFRITIVRSGLRLLALLLAVLAAGPRLAAQVRPVPAEKEQTAYIIIDHFGKLIEDRDGIETFKWISKGLQLRLDSTYIYGDSALIANEDRVYAYGNVIIQQGDSMSVFTDTLYYTRETDVANLVGEVVLKQGTRQLWTRNLNYYLDERYAVYSQGGVLVDDSLQVSSRSGWYDAKTESMIFRDSVIVLHPRFNLAADSLTYLALQKLVRFTGPTTIYTPSGQIYCESGFYDLQREKAEFTREATYAGGDKRARAERIVYDARTDEVRMYDQVRIRERDKLITGDSIRYLASTGETWIYGAPAFYGDSTRTINSPEIFYNEKTNRVSTRGPSEIVDGALTLKAKQLDFNDETGLGTATGDVEWRDTAQDIGVRAEILNYSREAEYVNAYGANRPLFYTIVDGDTLYLAADTLTMWREIDTIAVGDSITALDTIRMIRGHHDVRILKADLQGIADSLVFDGRDSLFTLFGRPVLWSDTSQFSGDTVTVSLVNKQIRDIRLIRNAIIISEILGRYYDQIKGRYIVAHFDSSAIRHMQVTGNAESVYYTRDEQQAFIGVNQTTCSRMFFLFLNGEINRLSYFGESTSVMKPMGDVDHDALRLEGFQWRARERPLTLEDLLRKKE